MRTDRETEATAYGVGSGIVLIQACALFPGLLPCLLLLLPFVLPLVALGLVAGLLALPVYGIRRLAALGAGHRAPSTPRTPGVLSTGH